jgi:hypothetical protein
MPVVSGHAAGVHAMASPVLRTSALTTDALEDALPELTPADAAVLLRRAVAVLSEHMPVDPGSLVPSAGAEHLAALADALARVGSGAASDGRLAAAGVGTEHVTALDSWIRIADGFALHGDTREASARSTLGEELRAVRMLIAPPTRQLTIDPRDVENRPEA